MAIDSSGNIIIVNLEDMLIQAVAAETGNFYGRAMTAGRIYTIAGGGTHGLGDGGPARKAQLDSGPSIAIDNHGNIVIPDSARIRVIAESNGTYYGVPMVKGDIYTIAGNGTRGFVGDRGPGLLAQIEDPQSVAVDSAGDLLIGDGIRIRQITG